MAEKLDPKEIVTLDELALSNMWETSALVEVLERKGILSVADILRYYADLIPTLRELAGLTPEGGETVADE